MSIHPVVQRHLFPEAPRRVCTQPRKALRNPPPERSGGTIVDATRPSPRDEVTSGEGRGCNLVGLWRGGCLFVSGLGVGGAPRPPGGGAGGGGGGLRPRRWARRPPPPPPPP